MEEYIQFVKDQINFVPDFAIVIGSGLSTMLDKVKVIKRIPYREIPNYPISTVKGHKGELIFGILSGKNVLIFNGRVHFYEGYTMRQVTAGVRLAAGLGTKNIIITNAAGAVNKALKAGDIMLIEDHINFIFADNPLRGEKGTERFVDMINAYDRDFLKKAVEVASRKGIDIRKGIYCAVAGPNYETMAELRFMNRIGIDAVGMSTVPEVIVARFLKMRVLGISCITDSIFNEGDISHTKVLNIANQCGKRIAELIESFLKEV